MVAGQETTHRLIENYLEQIDPGKRTIYTGLIPVLDSIIFTSRKLMCDQFGNRAISDQTSREITGMEFLSEVLEDLDSTHSLKHAGNQIPSTAVTQLILSCYTEALVSDLFTEHFDIAHFDEQKKRICALFTRMIPGQ